MILRPVSFVILFLMLGIFTLKYPILLLIGMVIMLIGLAAFFTQTPRIDRIGIIVLINYLYWLASGFSVGSILLTDLTSPAYFNGEGRIFLYYLPLLFFSFYNASNRHILLLKKLMVWTGIATVGLFLLWVAARPRFISGGIAGNLFGFTTSHHASGAMFSMIAMYLIVRGVEMSNRRYVMLGGIVILAVFATASRTSLVGLLAVAAWYLNRRRISMKIIIWITMICFLLLLVMPLIAEHAYKRSATLFSATTYAHIIDTAKSSNWEPGIDEEVEGKEQNILRRITVWVYAIKRFLQSPLFGIGFGRFNDIGLRLEGVNGIFLFALNGKRTLSVASAHNSYLHVLAESGILGLVLLGWLWKSLFNRLRKAERELASDSELSLFMIICQGMVVFVLTSSAFGHWCASPTVGIPAMTFTGVGIALARNIKSNRVRIQAGGIQYSNIAGKGHVTT